MILLIRCAQNNQPSPSLKFQMSQIRRVNDLACTLAESSMVSSLHRRRCCQRQQAQQRLAFAVVLMVLSLFYSLASPIFSQLRRLRATRRCLVVSSLKHGMLLLAGLVVLLIIAVITCAEKESSWGGGGGNAHQHEEKFISETAATPTEFVFCRFVAAAAATTPSTPTATAAAPLAPITQDRPCPTPQTTTTTTVNGRRQLTLDDGTYNNCTIDGKAFNPTASDSAMALPLTVVMPTQRASRPLAHLRMVGCIFRDVMFFTNSDQWPSSGGGGGSGSGGGGTYSFSPTAANYSFAESQFHHAFFRIEGTFGAGGGSIAITSSRFAEAPYMGLPALLGLIGDANSAGFFFIQTTFTPLALFVMQCEFDVKYTSAERQKGALRLSVMEVVTPSEMLAPWRFEQNTFYFKKGASVTSPERPGLLLLPRGGFSLGNTVPTNANRFVPLYIHSNTMYVLSGVDGFAVVCRRSMGSGIFTTTPTQLVFNVHSLLSFRYNTISFSASGVAALMSEIVPNGLSTTGYIAVEGNTITAAPPTTTQALIHVSEWTVINGLLLINSNTFSGFAAKKILNLNLAAESLASLSICNNTFEGVLYEGLDTSPAPMLSGNIVDYVTFCRIVPTIPAPYLPEVGYDYYYNPGGLVVTETPPPTPPPTPPTPPPTPPPQETTTMMDEDTTTNEDVTTTAEDDVTTTEDVTTTAQPDPVKEVPTTVEESTTQSEESTPSEEGEDTTSTETEEHNTTVEEGTTTETKEETSTAVEPIVQLPMPSTPEDETTTTTATTTTTTTTAPPRLEGEQFTRPPADEGPPAAVGVSVSTGAVSVGSAPMGGLESLMSVQMLSVFAAMSCSVPGVGGDSMSVFLTPLDLKTYMTSLGRMGKIVGQIALLAIIIASYLLVLFILSQVMEGGWGRAKDVLRHPRALPLIHQLFASGFAIESCKLLYGNDFPTPGEQTVGFFGLLLSVGLVAYYPCVTRIGFENLETEEGEGKEEATERLPTGHGGGDGNHLERTVVRALSNNTTNAIRHMKPDGHDDERKQATGVAGINGRTLSSPPTVPAATTAKMSSILVNNRSNNKYAANKVIVPANNNNSDNSTIPATPSPDGSPTDRDRLYRSSSAAFDPSSSGLTPYPLDAKTAVEDGGGKYSDEEGDGLNKDQAAAVVEMGERQRRATTGDTDKDSTTGLSPSVAPLSVAALVAAKLAPLSVAALVAAKLGVDATAYKDSYCCYTQQDLGKVLFPLRHLVAPKTYWLKPVLRSTRCVHSALRPSCARYAVGHHLYRCVLVCIVCTIPPQGESWCVVILAITAALCFAHALFILVTRCYRVPLENIAQAVQSAAIGAVAVCNITDPTATETTSAFSMLLMVGCLLSTVANLGGFLVELLVLAPSVRSRHEAEAEAGDEDNAEGEGDAEMVEKIQITTPRLAGEKGLGCRSLENSHNGHHNNNSNGERARLTTSVHVDFTDDNKGDAFAHSGGGVRNDADGDGVLQFKRCESSATLTGVSRTCSHSNVNANNNNTAHHYHHDSDANNNNNNVKVVAGGGTIHYVVGDESDANNIAAARTISVPQVMAAKKNKTAAAAPSSSSCRGSSGSGVVVGTGDAFPNPKMLSTLRTLSASLAANAKGGNNSTSTSDVNAVAPAAVATAVPVMTVPRPQHEPQLMNAIIDSKKRTKSHDDDDDDELFTSPLTSPPAVSASVAPPPLKNAATVTTMPQRRVIGGGALSPPPNPPQ